MAKKKKASRGKKPKVRRVRRNYMSQEGLAEYEAYLRSIGIQPE